jgi:hypothetical protein
VRLIEQFFLAVCMVFLLDGAVSGGDAPGEPSLPYLIDMSSLHADDKFEQFKEQGIFSCLSDADQKWLESKVDERQKQLAEFYAKLKSTHEPAGRYNAMDISDTSDGVPFNLIVKLTADRKDLAAALSPESLFKTDAVVPLAVMNPDVIASWLESAKVPANVSGKVMSCIVSEAAKVAVAGRALGTSPGAVGPLLNYCRQKMASRKSSWDAVRAALSVEQRQAFAKQMNGQESTLLIFSAKRRLEIREKRSWTVRAVPPNTRANSDQMEDFTELKDERVELVRDDDKKVIRTVDLKKGEGCGFTLTDPLAGAVAGYAGSRSATVEIEKHFYYWVAVPADSKAAAPAATQYESKAVPIRFDLPAGWDVDDDVLKDPRGMPQSFTLQGPTPAPERKLPYSPNLMFMVFNAGEEDRSIDDVVAHHEPPEKGQPAQAGENWTSRMLSRKTTKVDGEPGAIVVLEEITDPKAAPQADAPVPCSTIEAIVLHKQLIFRFSLTCAPEDAEQNTKVLQAILSSTKFVDDHLERWKNDPESK